MTVDNGQHGGGTRTVRLRAVVAALAMAAAAVAAAGGGAAQITIIPLPVEPGFYVADLDWAGPDRLVLATSRGLEFLDLNDGRLESFVGAEPLPRGIRDPHGVACDGRRVLAYSLRHHALAAWDLGTGERIFALRKPPGHMIADVALFAGGIAILGYPRGPDGRMDNPAGVAVWAGPLSADMSRLWPLHMLRDGAAAARRFEWALWPLGGALAVMGDGSLCVASTAEAGVFCYGTGGRLRRELGRGLHRLVGRGLERAFGELAGDPVARYVQIVNRQPWVDGLVAGADGPSLVVRLVEDGVVHWELWTPGPGETTRRLRLPLEVRSPTAKLRGEAREGRFAGVFSRKDGPGGTNRWFVAVFDLSTLGGDGP